MITTCRLAVLFLAVCTLSTEALADVRLAGVFGDHMVLQRDVPVPVWGWADPGEAVRVSFAGQKVAVTTDRDGRWRAALAPMKAGGPHTMTVRGTNTVKRKDVLVGEVWLCSGQSNMEWPVSRSANAKKEIAAARYAKIRHVKIPRRVAGSPVEDFDAPWQVCSPKTAGGFSAAAYFMARELHRTLRVPIGLINASWGGTRIEPWIPLSGFIDTPALADIAERVKADHGKKPANHQQPSVLFNGMVNPVLGFALRGAIWYQGESNHRDGAIYIDKMDALINGWRGMWSLRRFPFFFVQIAPFQYGKEDSAILPGFWEAQAAVVEAVPNTGMVVTNDIATLDNIHPPNKQDVGKRLALLALRRSYGHDVVDSGPTFESMTCAGKTLRVTFDHAKGLRGRDRKPLTHFEIAGATTSFVPADAKIEGDTVVLSSRDVAEPVAMRFAWHKLAQPNLVNGAGLPASAFRAGERPRPDFLAQIEEARGYTLVYDLDLSKLAAKPGYDARKTDAGGFDRVGYLLELQPASGQAQYVWVSMGAFTDDLGKIAVPTVASGAHFHQAVAAMDVVSNVEGLGAGRGLSGHIEFWPNNYGPANDAKVRGGSAKLWDFGDAPGQPVDGYGCMQVHNPGAGQTVFAINHWKQGGAGADIGIGNSDSDPRTRDWTFAGNGGSFTTKRLRIFVRPK